MLKQGNWKTVKVKKRDNLARIFKRLDIKQSDLAAIMALGSSTQALTHLHPGQELQVLVDNRQLEQLSFTNDGQNILVVTRSEQGFAAQTITNNTDTANNPPAVALTNATPEAASKTNTPSTAAPVPAKTAIIPNAIKSITLTINHSISEAVRRAGLSAKLANELSHVLSSNPSLIKQIHTGDKLALVYQKDQVADKKSLPNILIAELSSRHGKSLRLVRYTDPKGNTEYYTPKVTH
ncbi:MAG: hypothetical protein HWD59_05800 [Coxiellaceae bacterium]|nr:MAG: hypothetical protein HWD59_05800 [Coxiellaceae bacterium]